jgi:hypothetical protein
MIFSENRYPSSIGVEDMLFGIMRWRAVRAQRLAVLLMAFSLPRTR